ncbi:hypothetical protein ABZ924_11365 [Streptomyces sp. NPDC046876]|uniref:hypothetical protein n=1 Tax=Streptomyces sp. NPDC046876 TaxID=3155616 RepID=UPI0033E3B654
MPFNAPTCLAIGETATIARPTRETVFGGRSRTAIFYEDIVRPTCEQLGLTLLRADELRAADLPAEQLQRLVTEVDIVVADLGGAGQELSFSLGVRHALGRYTVHFIEGRDTPPRAGGAPCIEFPVFPATVAAARQRLTALLRDAEFGLSSVAPPPDPGADQGVSSPAGPEQEPPGLFDLVADAEAQLEAISGDMADVEAALTDLAAMSELIAEDMMRVGHTGASMGTRLAVVHRLAKAIDGPADDLEAAAERFARRMQAVVVAFGHFLEWARHTPRREWPDGVEGVLDQVVSTSLEIRTAAVGFQEVMGLINMFGAASRHLRGPARRIGGSLQMLFGSVAALEEWQDVALELKQS